MSRPELEALVEKYRTLHTLRTRREELEEQGRAGFSEQEGRARRGAFRQLARRFPGALRELDACSAETLARKRSAVESELARDRASQDAPHPLWMSVVFDYHDLLREALAVKLWLAERIGKQGTISREVLFEFHIWHAKYAHRGEARLTLEDLDSYYHPPGGRVLSLVWTQLSAKYGQDKEALERLVFGDPV